MPARRRRLKQQQQPQQPQPSPAGTTLHQLQCPELGAALYSRGFSRRPAPSVGAASGDFVGDLLWELWVRVLSGLAAVRGRLLGPELGLEPVARLHVLSEPAPTVGVVRHLGAPRRWDCPCQCRGAARGHGRAHLHALHPAQPLARRGFVRCAKIHCQARRLPVVARCPRPPAGAAPRTSPSRTLTPVCRPNGCMFTAKPCVDCGIGSYTGPWAYMFQCTINAIDNRNSSGIPIDFDRLVLVRQ